MYKVYTKTHTHTPEDKCHNQQQVLFVVETFLLLMVRLNLLEKHEVSF